MDNEIMKKHKVSLLGCVLGVLMLFAGVQSAFAQCRGTAYIRTPSTWTDLNIYYGNAESKIPKTAYNAETDYYVVDLGTMVSGNASTVFSIFTTKAGYASIDHPGVWGITKGVYDGVYSGRPGSAGNPGIACPGAGNEVYVAKDDMTGLTYIGKTPPSAKFIYVLVPEEKEWQSDDLMIHMVTSKGAKDTAMTPAENMCGWFSMVFEEAPTEAYFFLKNSPTTQLGINGLWGEEEVATPIDLSIIYEAYGVDRIYFIPDDNDWPDDGASQGWYVTDPGVPEKDDNTRCTFSLAAVIYDTDKSVNPLFTEDGVDLPGAGGVGSCVGVHHGMVMEDLGPDNKPQFNPASTWASTCFQNEASFKTLFNYTAGKNEVQCYDMPFRHYGKDTRWGYDSDSAKLMDNTGKVELIGGFSPLENSTDAGVVTMNGVTMGPLAAARTKRPAAGPVPNLADSVLGMPLDYYCKTPGWPSGANCEGKFANGDEAVTGAIWCWGSYCDASFKRWGQGTADDLAPDEKRNQHFCFESHATFTYNESQEFTFRGDDDIWVFINKKIAVDNGGAHLAAPGHVKLSNLNTTYGAGFLVPGNDYPLDIFFCDRRTTMSNVIIKTNMYIKQSTGLDFNAEQNADGGLKLDICVETKGGGDCASVALGSSGGNGTSIKCGPDIDADIHYVIKTRKGDTVSVLSPGMVNNGGIDLTNPKVPVIYPDRLMGLTPGNYRLYMEVNGKSSYYNFRIKGNLDVVANDVVFYNIDNEESVYPSNTKWTFVDKALAGNRIPLYISAPDDQGGVDLISAVNQNYTLQLSEGAVVYGTNNPDDPNYNVPLASLSRTIGATGIDTVWVTVPLQGLGTSASKKVTAKVRTLEATLEFFAPTIVFAEPATYDDAGKPLTWTPLAGDPDVDPLTGEEMFHWVGSDVDLYMIVTDPITGSLCTECSYLSLDIVEAAPNISGVMGWVDPVNQPGVAIARIKSTVEYVAPNAGFITVAAVENMAIAAQYGNMHFFKPPAPMPLVADIFDTKGKVTSTELEIPGPYFEKDQEYLDGRGDSIAIIYDRAIHEDSIPSFICVAFDEANLKNYNPYKMGISTNSKDTLMKCSYIFEKEAIAAGYAKSSDKRIIGLVPDSAFSSKVKTTVNVENKVASFTSYMWKGKAVKASFDKGMTDRMAPIIMSALVMPEAEGSSFDILTVAMSEAAVLDETYQKEGLQFYLNSATELSSSARYRVTKSQNGPVAKDTIKLRFENNNAMEPSPHVGDYIRFRTEGKENMWKDTVTYTFDGSDTVRVDDSAWNWNSPTDYASSKRLPSPWVAIEGAAEVSDASVNFAMTDPSKINNPPIEVFLVPQKFSLQDIKDSFPNTLGKYLRSDMKSLKNSSEQYKNVQPKDVYFFYEMDIFTSLGAFVTHKDQEIQCTDPKIFGEGKTCFDSNQNFFIAWNGTSDKNRLVGSGAYIVKWRSYVYLGAFKKKSKLDDTEVWGVRHPPKKK